MLEQGETPVKQKVGVLPDGTTEREIKGVGTVKQVPEPDSFGGISEHEPYGPRPTKEDLPQGE